MSKRLLLISLALGSVLLLAGGFFIAQNSLWPAKVSSETYQGDPDDVNGIRDFWISQIEGLGAEIAYNKFKSTVDDYEHHTHVLAHIFGEALYDIEGLTGIKYCDSAFEFGCYHSFFGLAVYHEGEGVLESFKGTCVDTFGQDSLPCQHGIGHGVLVYTGYDDIDRALEICETISDTLMGGCSSGVFMEYNFHTMEYEGGEEYIRPIEEDDYAPCNSLAERFQPSCYFEQVQWWESIYQFDYEKLGQLCANIPGGISQKDACFHGMGNYIAARHQYQVDNIIKDCALLPHADGQAWCHEGASWLVKGLSSRDEALKVCTALESPYQEACADKL